MKSNQMNKGADYSRTETKKRREDPDSPLSDRRRSSTDELDIKGQLNELLDISLNSSNIQNHKEYNTIVKELDSLKSDVGTRDEEITRLHVSNKECKYEIDKMSAEIQSKELYLNRSTKKIEDLNEHLKAAATKYKEVREREKKIITALKYARKTIQDMVEHFIRIQVDLNQMSQITLESLMYFINLSY